MIILDGKSVAATVKQEVKARAELFQRAQGRKPGLGVILVGEDPASQVYVRNKEKSCESANMISFKKVLPKLSAEEEIIEAVQEMNENPLIDAFLVQLPLPQGLDVTKITDFIDPKKDADGLHPDNMGLLWVGRKRVAPCTPWGVMRILKHFNIQTEGRSACVVGRSQIVGKPMAHLLTEANATVTVCHSRTPKIREIMSSADIVVVAAGKREMFGRDYFKKGAVVIDVGIHGSGQGKTIVGDVKYSELVDWASAATPVPGGVGPMTVACLMENTITLAEKNN